MKVVQSFVMAATLLAGCATPGDPPEGTTMLLEVAHVLTRQEILTGEVRMPLADGQRDPVRQRAQYDRFGFKTWLKEVQNAPARLPVSPR